MRCGPGLRGAHSPVGETDIEQTVINLHDLTALCYPTDNSHRPPGPLLYRCLTLVRLLVGEDRPEHDGKAEHVGLLRGPGVDVVQVLGGHVVQCATALPGAAACLPLLIVLLLRQLAPRLEGSDAEVSYLQESKPTGCSCDGSKQIRAVFKLGAYPVDEGTLTFAETAAPDRFKTATSEQTSRKHMSSAVWKISHKKSLCEILVSRFLRNIWGWGVVVDGEKSRRYSREEQQLDMFTLTPHLFCMFSVGSEARENRHFLFSRFV